MNVINKTEERNIMFFLFAEEAKPHNYIIVLQEKEVDLNCSQDFFSFHVRYGKINNKN